MCRVVLANQFLSGENYLKSLDYRIIVCRYFEKTNRMFNRYFKIDSINFRELSYDFSKASMALEFRKFKLLEGSRYHKS